jgi:hypothetical protein
LQSVFKEALSAEKQADYTLKTAMEALQKTTDKLHRFGKFMFGGAVRSGLLTV